MVERARFAVRLKAVVLGDFSDALDGVDVRKVSDASNAPIFFGCLPFHRADHFTVVRFALLAEVLEVCRLVDGPIGGLQRIVRLDDDGLGR